MLSIGGSHGIVNLSCLSSPFRYAGHLGQYKVPFGAGHVINEC